MGIQKQNVPTRFDEETLMRIDEEKERHGFEYRSEYIRKAMKKWLRMVADGTVQLLDFPMQVKHSDNCERCEQREQSLQIEFPSAALESQLGPKPPVRVLPSGKHSHGREFRGVSRRMAASGAWFGTSLIIHSTPLNERAA